MAAKSKRGGARENAGRKPTIVGRQDKMVTLDKPSLAAIAKWRRKYDVPSDSEAIREMLQRAIKAGRN